MWKINVKNKELEELRKKVDEVVVDPNFQIILSHDWNKYLENLKMTKDEASKLLEDVLDTLVEVGNGVTDEMLHEAADKLFRFRDEYFKKIKDEK